MSLTADAPAHQGIEIHVLWGVFFNLFEGFLIFILKGIVHPKHTHRFVYIGSGHIS